MERDSRIWSASPRMKELLKTPLIFDGRNQYSPPAMKSMGFEYVCIGRC